MDAGHLQSKQPRSVLSGSYGHPVHPILVTLPIGAWVCSFIFDLVSYGSSQPRTWSVAAMWLILVGVLGAAAAAPIGPLILSIIGIAVIGASGFLGGRLAYHYGVRVPAPSRQQETKIRTIGEGPAVHLIQDRFLTRSGGSPCPAPF
jgi:uncharacterized membrane protein